MENKVVTVSYGRVKGKAKSYPYYQPCIYREYTKKNGEKVWKLYRVLGIARRSYKLAEMDALDFCDEYDCEYRRGIRQWNKVIQ